MQRAGGLVAVNKWTACHGVQVPDRAALKTQMLNYKLQTLWKHWPLMSRIRIEITRAYHQVLRVGCFQNEQSAGLQGPARLFEQSNQFLQLKMFDEMKSGNGPQAVFRQSPQITSGVGFNYNRIAAAGLVDERAIRFDSARL